MPERDKVGAFGAGQDLGTQFVKQLRYLAGAVASVTERESADARPFGLPHPFQGPVKCLSPRSRRFPYRICEQRDPLKRGSVRTEIRVIFQAAQHFDHQG